MSDKYLNFEELAKYEHACKDFLIKHVSHGSKVLIMGPHAGSIEPGTGEISAAVAGDELSLYLFEGIKPSKNGDLHITSTNFDEPHALRMVKECEFVLTIHGEGSEEKLTYLGGRNQALQKHIADALCQAGFTTGQHEDTDLQGTSKRNICNRGTSKLGGVQLELGKGLRKTFFKSLKSSDRQQTTDEFDKFTTALREGLKNTNLLQI